MHHVLDDDIFDGDEISDAHRSRQQREYKDAYADWIASLSPAERKLMEAVGVAEPDSDARHIGRTSESIDDEILKPEDVAQHASAAGLHLLTEILSIIANSGNVGLYLTCALSALSAPGYEETTLEQIGARYNCSKQRAGKVRTFFTDAFCLPPAERGREIEKRALESLQRCRKNSEPLSPGKSTNSIRPSKTRASFYSLRRSG